MIILVFSVSLQKGNFASTMLLDYDFNLESTTLNVLTRYSVTITSEFRTEFLSTQKAIDLGITDMHFYQATTDEGWKKLLEDPSKSVDLAWGGGQITLNKMDDWGLIKHIDNTTLIDYINLNVPDIIAGTEMKSFDTSGDLIWTADSISSYGFTVNHNFLGTLGLPVPHTWEDLASPVYYIDNTTASISMGDPPLTTSNTRIYQIILQAFGWDSGWSVLTRMGANARIYPGSVATRAAVVAGEVGIGMTVDFYGIIAQRENPSCEYIIPEGQSTILPNPIALGINVDNQPAAEVFIEYILSAEGQSIWMHENLDRLPVNEAAFHTSYGETRDDLYNLYNETLSNAGISFDETLAEENLHTTKYYFHNTITKKHDKLKLTWGEMVTRFRDNNITIPYFCSLEDRLGEVDMTLQESIDWNEPYSTDPLFASTKDLEWQTFAKNKYDDIYFELLGFVDDEFEDNDNIEEASLISDEGFYNLFYKDVDYYKISMEIGYSYNITLDFNQSIIDLDMYLLPPDYSGDIAEILDSSCLHTAPERFSFMPLESVTYILLINHYFEVSDEDISPSNYTLTIEKIMNIHENLENIKTVLFPFALLMIVFTVNKKKRKTISLS